jgi:hypothetical protein
MNREMSANGFLGVRMSGQRSGQDLFFRMGNYPQVGQAMKTLKGNGNSPTFLFT